jgi:hypothetical protein
MKQLRLNILFMIAMAALAACDKVDLPIPEPDLIVIIDSFDFSTVDSANLNRAFKKTYVEEFTGHKCITCPANTRLLIQQQEENKERMIVNSIHAGNFAVVEPPKYPTDFNSDYGDLMYTHYDMATQPIPSAMVNRRSFPSFNDLIIFNRTTTFWDKPIDQENTNTQTKFALGIAADLIDSTNLFYIRVSTEVLEDVDGNYRVLVFCQEDSVVAEQLDGEADSQVYPDKIVTDYVHRHVFRAKLNSDQSITGNPLINGSVTAGTWLNHEFNAYLPYNVVTKEHTRIIALIVNADTEEVEQSEEVHVHIH